jgi:hypothetical protein
MVEHAIKLNVRRRVQKTKDKLDESFGDEDFDKQLEALNNDIDANNVNINVNENSNANTYSENLNNNNENNNMNENNNANNIEGVEDQPKKKRGRPKKVPGALAESPKSPPAISTQAVRRSNRRK